MDAFLPNRWLALLEWYEHKCAYCDASDVELTKDHVIPRCYRKTTPLYDRLQNIVPACKRCNKEKGRGNVKLWMESKGYDYQRFKVKKDAFYQSIRHAIDSAYLNFISMGETI